MISRNAWTMNVKPPRPDWREERGRIDLAAVATNLLGPAPGRRGERGLWWPCPFHEDRNPSFRVDASKGLWKCFGCSEHGDAAALVMRLRNLSFPEAVAHLTGKTTPTFEKARQPACAEPIASQVVRAQPKSPFGEIKREIKADPTGLPEADALALVEDATARLWSPEGADALAYLTGPERCLSAETIRAARLGWTRGTMVPTRDGDRAFHASGIVIPWFDGDRLVVVKIRQPPDRRPKYAEAYRNPARLVCFPGLEAIRPGRPLVIVEGEFDSLLLGQELDGLASVVTLGSASAQRGDRFREAARSVSPWYVATDADAAGDKSADAWPARARRVRPPGPYKDWTEAKAAGVDLNRWWRDVLAGVDRPPLFSWPELSGWRWGGADEAPGIDVPNHPCT